MFARHQRRPRGRAHRRRRIGLPEQHTLFREAIQPRRFMQVGSIAAEVHRSQVVGQDEDDVRAF
jgi:hypothetical protein